MKTKSGNDIPEDLAGALKRSGRLLAAWEILRPSCRREYAEYVAEAVKPETRRRRIETVLRQTAGYAARHPEKTAAVHSASAGVKTGPSRLKRPRYPMPGVIRSALRQQNLMGSYHSRPPYQQNDYIGWITRAKLAITRQKRLDQMLDEPRRGDAYMKMPHSPRFRGTARV